MASAPHASARVSRLSGSSRFAVLILSSVVCVSIACSEATDFFNG